MIQALRRGPPSGRPVEFGEDGSFGYGPIQHEKVWEVPFVEGKLR